MFTDQRKCWRQCLRFHVSLAAPASAETPGKRRWSASGVRSCARHPEREYYTVSTNGWSPSLDDKQAKYILSDGIQLEITHRPFSALKSLIPSAGPQIWITSSLVSFNRSAPGTQKQDPACYKTTSLHIWTWALSHQQRGSATDRSSGLVSG